MNFQENLSVFFYFGDSISKFFVQYILLFYLKVYYTLNT
jgi:hypothetical protein